jgi:hypothetical protein
MAASIEEKVIEKLRVLPEDQQTEVLKFVEDLARLETKADNGDMAQFGTRLKRLCVTCLTKFWQAFRGGRT